MKRAIRETKLPTRLSFRVTEEEAKRINECTAQAGVSMSELLRSSFAEAEHCPPWARLILAEFLALRSVLVDLQRDLIQGVRPSDERIKAILEAADNRKMALADGRLNALASKGTSK